MYKTPQNSHFEISYCFEHFSFSRYILMTLHLPQPLTDGKNSKVDKMSYIHPNSNSSHVMDSACQGEHMRKNPF
jgi:hypothetical protein